MDNHKKPRICIALPGTDYVPQAPLLFANTLPLLPYLQEDFEIIILFRKALGKPALDYPYMTILDINKLSASDKQGSTANFSPTGLFNAFKYLRVLRRFTQQHIDKFDLVLERQWSLVGALSQSFSQNKVPAIFVLEAEFYTTRKANIQLYKHPIGWLSTVGFKKLLPILRRKWIQSVDRIVVETDEMKSFLLKNSYISKTEQAFSIPNGINPEIFYPRDRDLCREKLNIKKDEIVLTYVGSLNRFIQEPGPIIQALGQVQTKNITLHLIGDGLKRKEFENLAQQYNTKIIFHGRLTQPQAVQYIGAANLCIAPYNQALFPSGEFTSASLKVCEYLACGRPVMTIPCSRMNHLLQGEKYGFLVSNTVKSYKNFFQAIMDTNTFVKKEGDLIADLQHGVLKNRQIVMTWEDIAQLYKNVIWSALKENS
ncbi:MAG: glycosyltransferase family 4 protein [Cyanothece sp. SIO1E1]|nr:glycosyltransferase family 4 protein [Cyanothece sp. SIO1E1]